MPEENLFPASSAISFPSIEYTFNETKASCGISKVTLVDAVHGFAWIFPHA